MTMSLEIWTIYDHPKDFPNNFVARRFEVRLTMESNASAIVATSEFIVSPTLNELRILLQYKGLAPITREPGDDANIIESWM